MEKLVSSGNSGTDIELLPWIMISYPYKVKLNESYDISEFQTKE